MGNLQTAIDAEAGAASLEELRKLGVDMTDATDAICQLALNYGHYRDGLSDPTDEAFADESLSGAINESRLKIDALPASSRQWVDFVFSGLGYVKQ